MISPKILVKSRSDQVAREAASFRKRSRDSQDFGGCFHGWKKFSNKSDSSGKVSASDWSDYSPTLIVPVCCGSLAPIDIKLRQLGFGFDEQRPELESPMNDYMASVLDRPITKCQLIKKVWAFPGLFFKMGQPRPRFNLLLSSVQNLGASWIRTQIVGVEGEDADHSTTTTVS